MTKIPISKLHCPPVWGFDGSAKYVDFKHVVYHCGRSASDNHCCKDSATAVNDYSTDRKMHKYLQNVLLQSESLIADDGEHVLVSNNIGISMITYIIIIYNYCYNLEQATVICNIVTVINL